MIIIRPITKKDTKDFVDFAFHTGRGMSSMPKNKDRLEQTVLHAEQSFANQVITPGDEHYLFILEDLKSGVKGGTCGVTARTGRSHPLYFYRKEYLEKEIQKTPFLRIVHYFSMPSEIGSLFLVPEFRHHGQGRLLSLSRFLFMANHPKRFDHVVFAAMRGYFEPNGQCTFWEGIGRHFFDIDFDALIKLQETTPVEIASILPNYPIFIKLLPQDVQMSIGRVHQESLSALNILIQEGFQLTNEIDALDGGPKIEAELKDIRTIKDSNLATIIEISNTPLDGELYMISNTKLLDFRACYARIKTTKGIEGISVTAEVAEALKVERGDTIRYVSPNWVGESL